MKNNFFKKLFYLLHIDQFNLTFTQSDENLCKNEVWNCCIMADFCSITNFISFRKHSVHEREKKMDIIQDI